MDKISQVFNNLFIGGEFVAAYREVLVEHNVRFILNCAAPQCKSHFAHEVENYVSESIVLWDAEDANAAQYFDATFDFIDKAIIAGLGCLLFDKSGNSRAPTIALAYLMRKTRCSFLEGLQHITSIRKSVNINKAFIWQLTTFEKKMFGVNFTELEPEKPILTPDVVELKPYRLLMDLDELVLKTHAQVVFQHVVAKLRAGKWLDVIVLVDRKANTTFELVKLVRRAVFVAVRDRVAASLKDGQIDVSGLLEYLDEAQDALSAAVHQSVSLLNAFAQGLTSAFQASPKAIGTSLGDSIHSIITSKASDGITDDQKMYQVGRRISLLQYFPRDLDTFIYAYSANLTRRLLSAKIEILPRELELAEMFKKANVTKLCEKIDVMVHDVETSLMLSQESKSVISATVVCGEAWPLKPLVGPIAHTDVPDFGFRSYFVPSFPVYPLDAAQEWYDYKTSYEQTQYGRKLILLPHLGDADVIFHARKKKYIINVPTPIMIALGALADLAECKEVDVNGCVTFAQLLERTRLPKKLLQSAMYSLACERYPSVNNQIVSLVGGEDHPASKVISGETKFSVNGKFETTLTKFRIPMRKYVGSVAPLPQGL